MEACTFVVSGNASVRLAEWTRIQLLSYLLVNTKFVLFLERACKALHGFYLPFSVLGGNDRTGL